MTTIAHTQTVDQRHGGAYDRGSADSYYGRPFAPHYYEGDSYHSFPIFPSEGSQEWADYALGYKENTEARNFKEWG